MTYEPGQTPSLDNLEKLPPCHPGKAIVEFFVHNRKIGINDIIKSADIDRDKLINIVEGRADMDQETARKLKQTFGEVADTLNRMQYVFTYFRENKKLPQYSDIQKVAPL